MYAPNEIKFTILNEFILLKSFLSFVFRYWYEQFNLVNVLFNVSRYVLYNSSEYFSKLSNGRDYITKYIISYAEVVQQQS